MSTIVVEFVIVHHIFNALRNIQSDSGQLKIAEVESRFENVRTFVDNVKACGFQHVNTDSSSKFFVFLNFKKVHSLEKSKVGKHVPTFSLKPCLYKKR